MTETETQEKPIVDLTALFEEDGEPTRKVTASPSPIIKDYMDIIFGEDIDSRADVATFERREDSWVRITGSDHAQDVYSKKQDPKIYSALEKLHQEAMNQ